jgi:hypothetical protein
MIGFDSLVLQMLGFGGLYGAEKVLLDTPALT